MTGSTAGRPPSAWTVSLITISRRSSIMPSRSGGRNSVPAPCSASVRRQRIAHEARPDRHPQRKRRIAAEDEMLRPEWSRWQSAEASDRSTPCRSRACEIVADRAFQMPVRPARVGVDLALHARPQHQAEGAGMGEQQFQIRPAVEEARADDVEDIDGVVEQIAGDDRQSRSRACAPCRPDRPDGRTAARRDRVAASNTGWNWSWLR